MMNKNELIEAVANQTGQSKTQIKESIDAVFGSIRNALQSGNEVRLVDFGTFLVSERKATTGRNPRTGEKINIPAAKQAKFRPGKALKDAVNE